MDRIVAFSLPDEATGLRALEALRGLDAVHDVVLVYRDDRGGAHLHQTSDVTVGDAAMGGALLGAVIGVLAGPFVALAAGGAALGAFYGAARDKGIEDGLMYLAGTRLTDDQVAVFVLTDEASATVIESAVRAYARAEGLDACTTVGSFAVSETERARRALGGEDSHLGR